jgi:hypothetical protein
VRQRAKALGSVFGSVVSLESSAEGRRVLEWAMLQLAIMRSAGANEELDRIANQLGLLQKSAPGDLELAELVESVNTIKEARQR